MKYFKIIQDGIIIAAITSNNFMRYLSITDCFVRANEQVGEYATYKGQFYRSTWMQPIVKVVPYTEVFIIEIDEEEYDALIEALETNEIIVDEEINDNPPEKHNYVDPLDELTLEFVKDSKINAMNYACRTTIESGFDLVLRGETRHFSLTTQDQLNLMSLGAMTQTQSLIPYHADGEESEFYTAEEINQIISAAASFKNYQLSYYNSLKTYINTLDTIEAIAAITYGTPIPDEYKSDVLKVLE